MTASAPAIRMNGIHKAFGPVHANRGARLQVGTREIHALVGENGAGKSTLMRILAGLYAPDAGTVEVGTPSGELRDVTGWSTADAIKAGVGMVHQHFMLVRTLTVAENVVLGREPVRGAMLDIARAISDVKRIGDQYGLRVDPARHVGDLSVGEAQRVEILKTLFRGARILILDEPTAVLSPLEVKELWSVLRRLRDDGATIVLITHKLDEVMDVSDAITVMRQGETVARMDTGAATPEAIARAMVGRDVALVTMRKEDEGPRNSLEGTPRSAAPRFALSVNSLVVTSRGRRAVDGISFDVAAGEILGIAGVEGNGQTELIEAIAGLCPVTSGTIALGGRDVTHASVRERTEAGLAHIPEDRHRRGLVLEYTVAENLILGDQHHYATGARRAWALDGRRIEANATDEIQRFDIRPPDAELPARALSGGNQQKVVIAREMGGAYEVLLASQPTRGVDVGAIEFIHAQLRAAREAGKAILLVSAELSEILALADRVAVMYGGRIIATLPRREASEERLGPLMTGATDTTRPAA
ncbi:MAG TPA: ABC transporter ATP-binding protein [Gemmatimonadaceae bacterium]|nr:ABC transporter ATP-binding protein [Gemmatimonadaceae bacterium]